MMKKNGFTLAEVLITLAIIGVVATMTLPALMTNTQEQQAKTGLKKAINTLTEAGQMNQAVAGFDYASMTTTDVKDSTKQSLYGILSNRTTLDPQLSGTSTAAANSVNTGDATKLATNYVAFFRDGTALSVNMANTTLNATSGAKKNSEMQGDGLAYGVTAVYDTNGAKGPNLLSNCEGKPALLINSSESKDTTEISKCNDKSKRVIKDQFGIRLRNGFAVPNGAAARWAYDN